MENKIYRKKIKKSKEFIFEKQKEVFEMIKHDNDNCNGYQMLSIRMEEIRKFQDVLELLDLLENKEVIENEKENHEEVRRYDRKRN